MTDNDLPDVMEVVPQDEIDLPETIPDVETTDLVIEDKLVDYWALPKSKSIGTLTEYMKEDELTQKVLLSSYVYSSMRSMVINNACHVKIDEYQHPLVTEGNPILTECPDGRIDLDMVTKALCSKIAMKMSDLKTLIEKITAKKQSIVPELPRSVINVIHNAFRYPADEEWMIPEGYRRSLAYVLMSIVYRGKSPATDVFMQIYKDVAGSIQSNIIRKHLVKDILPSNAKVAIQKEIYEIVEQVSADDLEERIRCLGV